MPRARQNTNGGIEAYHLTLKRCIDRWLGEMQGRRMDGLVHLLFEKMLSFFMYSMYLKREGLVANLKAENVAISSLHLAQHELKNAKVGIVLSQYSRLLSQYVSSQQHVKECYWLRWCHAMELSNFFYVLSYIAFFLRWNT
jgi:hypothetical protein